MISFRATIMYYAWISSSGARDKMRDGALFAGLDRDVPDEYRHLLDPAELRHYVVIRDDDEDIA